jgi:hypothetical protein
MPAGQLSFTTMNPCFSASLPESSFTPAKLPGGGCCPPVTAGAVMKVWSAPWTTPREFEATTR